MRWKVTYEPLGAGPGAPLDVRLVDVLQGGQSVLGAGRPRSSLKKGESGEVTVTVACAGLEPTDIRGWKRFDEIRAGGYDPAARLVEMDRDGLLALRLAELDRPLGSLTGIFENCWSDAFGNHEPRVHASIP